MKLIPKSLTRIAGKLILKLKHSSPEICVVSGILLGGAAVVMTGINTWKGKEELSEDVKLIKEAKIVEPEESEEETAARKKELGKRRITFIKHIGKRYWLPVALGMSSAGLVWGGRTLLRKELSAMTALAATLSESYKKLYERVKEEFGEEKAQELAYGVRMTEGIDGDTGEVSQVAITDKKKLISPYAVYFDPGEWCEETGQWIWKNYEWNTVKIYNIQKIRNAQNYFNDILHSRGWVLWGEVAQYLGLKPSPTWHRVGWIDDGSGRKHIELGVLEGPHQLPFNKKFMNEHDPQNTALIDPNVDGCIDMVFDNIEKFDYRCGRRGKKILVDKNNAELWEYRVPVDSSKEETVLIRK